MQMIDWHIGAGTKLVSTMVKREFTIIPGTREGYGKVLAHYATASSTDNWRVHRTAIELFPDTALKVAAQLGYTTFRKKIRKFSNSPETRCNNSRRCERNSFHSQLE